jgi:type IV secretory pathway VirB6-like protein
MNIRLTHQQLLWGFFLACGGLALLMLMSDPAFAQAAPTSRNFSCASGRATGDLIAKAASCPEALKWDNIFSFLVCHIETITSQIFGNMYCGIIKELIPAVKAVLTLAVITFGVGFTIGVIPATGREFMVFLLKIAFVLAFATQAEYMIGYGYNFLVTGLREGTTLAMSSIIPPNEDGSPVTTTTEMYGFLDRGLFQIVGFATETAGENWGPGSNPCQNAIFAALLVMAIAFPPLFLLSVMLLFKMMMVFLRSCFGYLFSIVGIAFLMVLSPIFLSFSLFKQTRAWFDKWLGYLASFALQVVIIFAFIAMVLSMNPTSLLTSISQLVVERQETRQTSGWRWPWEYCTLCKFEVIENGTVDDAGTVTGGSVKTLGEGVNINPATDRLRCKAGNESYAIDQSITPNGEGGGVSAEEVNALFQLTSSVIISLIILAYVIDQMLFYVPSIAWRLASSMSSGVYAPQVVGGNDIYSQSTAVNAGPLELMQSTGDGFMNRFIASTRDTQGNTRWNTDTISATVAGVEGASAGLGNALTNNFVQFFINPTRSNTGED